MSVYGLLNVYRCIWTGRRQDPGGGGGGGEAWEIQARKGSGGGRTGVGGELLIIIKMDSDESHFKVSLMWGKMSQDSVHNPQPFWRERRAEAESNQGPSAYQPNALPLDQTVSITT